MRQDIDWSKLGFHYTEPDYIVRAACHDGVWEEPYATKDKYLHLHVSATCLQYGQEAFEGLKAFRGIDGKIRIFRWRDNAKRMAKSAEGLFMKPVPETLFGKAIRLALEKNLDFVPPYGTGATLYFRPLLIGTTPRLGVGPGHDFEFIVIPSPIGPYYPGKFHCTTFVVNRYVDRAAPFGTGQFKVGGNYASSFRATEAAHAMGMDCLFLDAKYHRYIDECSAANFIGIKQSPITYHQSPIVEYLTPRSSAILPSITNDSLMILAREKGLKVTRRHIRLEELAEMSEAAACGTACVISPIDKVLDPERGKTYTFGTEPGPVLTELYRALKDIQYGRAEDKHHWCDVIDK
ncbi:MAG: branched-chain amino acid aminotransferase [Paludibacteraceae bacterium]|nr:branched-chain amino acid aminotransferase [Paludibacteraceae bacterium]MBR6492746.1 branched-chain amino acid aminotransferase [Paludibacteraceae bacterium]